MSLISEEKRDRIKEEIMRMLFEQYPKMWWTYEVGEGLIRDDEFALRLLLELERDGLVIVYKESKGNKVKRKWGLSKSNYEKFTELYG